MLQGVSVELRSGDVVLLRGDNGSGKTTLLNILTGNLEPDRGEIELTANHHAEHFRFPRPWWKNLNPADHFTPERVAKQGVGRSWQDIRLFKTQTLGDNIAVATPRQRGENPVSAVLRPLAVRQEEKENVNSAAVMISQLGLQNRESSFADQVSLGQSKRVAIARAVNAGAKILFLDEPLAGLDPRGIEQVLTLLEALVRAQQLTLVIVEHVFHIQRLLGLVTRVWTLNRGKISLSSPSEFKVEKDARTVSHWLRDLADSPEGGSERPLANDAWLSVLLPKNRRRGRLVLEVKDLVVSRGSRPIIGEGSEGLSFRLYEGEVAILQAPNGWGKTTLLQALAGILPVSRGQIVLEERPLDTLPPWVRSRLGVSFLPSQNQLFPGLTVQENLQLAGITGPATDIDRLRRRKLTDLSGGERQRVALQVACAPDKKCLLLDEPFSMLDREGLDNMQATLLQNSASAVLIAIPGTRERD